MNRFLLIALVAISLSACSFERDGGEGFLVRLPAVTETPTVAAKSAPTLEVILPDAPAQLDSRRVGLRRPDGAFDYYAGMRWADFLPLVVQSALVRDLSHDGLVAASDDTTPGPWLYQLDSSIEYWSVRHPPEGPVASLKLTWHLSKARVPIASGEAEGLQSLDAESPRGIAAAFAGAYAQAEQQLAQEIMAKIALPSQLKRRK